MAQVRVFCSSLTVTLIACVILVAITNVSAASRKEATPNRRYDTRVIEARDDSGGVHGGAYYPPPQPVYPPPQPVYMHPQPHSYEEHSYGDEEEEEHIPDLPADLKVEPILSIEAENHDSKKISKFDRVRGSHLDSHSHHKKKLSKYDRVRGVSRHKAANKKLYKDPIQPNIDRFLGYHWFTDTQQIAIRPLSTLPWIQLATLGITIWGLNVVFVQFILDMKEPPNLTLPFFDLKGKEAVSTIANTIRESLDYFEEAFGVNDARGLDEHSCRPLRLCEARQLLTHVPYVNDLVDSYGVRPSGLREPYRRALDTATSGAPCSGLPQTDNCAESALSLVLRAAKYLTSAEK